MHTHGRLGGGGVFTAQQGHPGRVLAHGPDELLLQRIEMIETEKDQADSVFDPEMAADVFGVGVLDERRQAALEIEAVIRQPPCILRVDRNQILFLRTKPAFLEVFEGRPQIHRGRAAVIMDEIGQGFDISLLVFFDPQIGR